MDLQTVYKDIFLTDRYFIKGNVVPLGSRLSNHLDKSNRRFVTVESAVVTELAADGEVTPVPSMMLGTDEILFAHELIESAGDVYRKYQSPDFDLDFVKIVLKGPQGVTLHGKIRPENLDCAAFQHRFVVLQQPRMDDLHESLEPEIDLLGSMSYLIVNKDKIGYVFRY